ncbi:major facilitator superfamily protein [Paenibacillus sp. TCA20]|uniref:MFS transporter n=1 Tax=Paenibacillus urinalis TaxID=521520 RepID=A0ABY7XFN7_9BACL|nr:MULTISPECIES: MFS transporter [Paenibacillus]WDI04592.1 MFS transporter [Paenibacillus urinalis]GAK42826.1 major facilitator superfamily protein [Paenibacillus sp. TCA20]
MASNSFRQLTGNAKGCLIYEPLFLIPYSMFVTYSSIFMYELGVTETGIGWITTIGLLVQVLSSFLSGYLTDRMGRKRALLYFDVLSWSVATLLWAVSQNFWFFVIAAIVNGFQKVPHTAFYCLLVEDTAPKERTYVFTLLQLISVVGGLFAPIGGLLVYHFSLVPGVRIMFVLACIMMTIQFIGRHYATRETDIGYRKMKEAKSMSIKEGMSDYLSVLKVMLRSPLLLIIFAVYILFNFQTTVKTTYISIFMVEYLQLGSGLISVFPAFSSIIMLMFMRWIMPRIAESQVNRIMVWGFIISVLSNVILVVAPKGDLILLSVSTIVAAIGTMMTYPYLETAVANAIDDENRAKIFALLQVLILIVISPSGVIGGWAYGIDPRIPFLLVAGAFAISIPLMMVYTKKQHQLDSSAMKNIHF